MYSFVCTKVKYLWVYGFKCYCHVCKIHNDYSWPWVFIFGSLSLITSISSVTSQTLPYFSLNKSRGDASNENTLIAGRCKCHYTQQVLLSWNGVFSLWTFMCFFFREWIWRKQSRLISRLIQWMHIAENLSWLTSSEVMTEKSDSKDIVTKEAMQYTQCFETGKLCVTEPNIAGLMSEWMHGYHLTTYSYV